jgi:hypothetical protein
MLLPSWSASHPQRWESARRGRSAGSCAAVGRHLRPWQGGGSQRVLEGGREIDAGPERPLASGLSHRRLDAEGNAADVTGDLPIPLAFDPVPGLEAGPEVRFAHRPQDLRRGRFRRLTHHLEQAFDGIVVGFKIGQPPETGEAGADRLGLRIGRKIAELLDEVPQQEILAAPSALGDVGEDQPFQVGRVIPPGGRGVARQPFAPDTGEGDGRLVKISGMTQAGVSLPDHSPIAPSGFLPMRGG